MSGKSAQKQIYILGSVHDLAKIPKGASDYSFILEKMNPDLILIEWPVSWFDKSGQVKKNYSVPLGENREVEVEVLLKNSLKYSGYQQPELAQIFQYSQKYSCPLLPFDQKNRNKIGRQRGYYRAFAKIDAELAQLTDPKLMKVRDEIKQISVSGGCVEKGLASINSLACDQKYQSQMALKQKLVEWDQKNQLRGLKMYLAWMSERRMAMAKNICHIVNNRNERRVVVSTGGSHRFHLIEDLPKCTQATLVKYWGDFLAH